jgi:hypothetical protein
MGMDHTWMKAVDKIIPVPNCFKITKIMFFCDMRMNEVAKIGLKTPSALVARMTNNSPTRSFLLYDRSIRTH